MTPNASCPRSLQRRMGAARQVHPRHPVEMAPHVERRRILGALRPLGQAAGGRPNRPTPPVAPRASRRTRRSCPGTPGRDPGPAQFEVLLPVTARHVRNRRLYDAMTHVGVLLVLQASPGSGPGVLDPWLPAAAGALDAPRRAESPLLQHSARAGCAPSPTAWSRSCTAACTSGRGLYDPGREETDRPAFRACLHPLACDRREAAERAPRTLQSSSPPRRTPRSTIHRRSAHPS